MRPPLRTPGDSSASVHRLPAHVRVCPRMRATSLKPPPIEKKKKGSLLPGARQTMARVGAPPSPDFLHMSDPNLSSFIWSVADLLRGDYKQSEYGKVILPFTVLRRLDCVLEATKPAVLTELAIAEGRPEPGAVSAAEVRAALLQHVAARHEEADGRSGPHQGEPVRVHAGVLARRARHLSSPSTSTPRSTGWPSPGCCIWSRRSSPTSTCTPTSSATPRWARSSRS